MTKFYVLLSACLLAGMGLIAAPGVPEVKDCHCVNCKCTPESHCGCLSGNGCKCTPNTSCCGDKCQPR